MTKNVALTSKFQWKHAGFVKFSKIPAPRKLTYPGRGKCDVVPWYSIRRDHSFYWFFCCRQWSEKFNFTIFFKKFFSASQNLILDSEQTVLIFNTKTERCKREVRKSRWKSFKLNCWIYWLHAGHVPDLKKTYALSNSALAMYGGKLHAPHWLATNAALVTKVSANTRRRERRNGRSQSTRNTSKYAKQARIYHYAEKS